jgi:hypothetical protein
VQGLSLAQDCRYTFTPCFTRGPNLKRGWNMVGKKKGNPQGNTFTLLVWYPQVQALRRPQHPAASFQGCVFRRGGTSLAVRAEGCAVLQPEGPLQPSQNGKEHERGKPDRECEPQLRHACGAPGSWTSPVPKSRGC